MSEKPSNVKFTLEIDSGNQDVVDDPAGAIVSALNQVRSRLPLVMDGTRCKLRDANGNTIGRYWAEIDP